MRPCWRSDGKSHLRVIDYIGNHRMFARRPGLLLGEAIPLLRLVEMLHEGVVTDGLPPGCQVTYDLEAVALTMDKAGIAKGQEYTDRWLSDDLFEWHSQNRTTQASSDGQLIRNHPELGVHVHLFVRESNRGAFRYEGEMAFEGWRSDAPITVEWRRLRA